MTYNRYDGATDGASLLGYNVYRDGEKLNAEPVTANSYTDAVSDSKTHKYKVTAVYDEGESNFSEELSVGATTGINTVATDLSSAPAAFYNIAGQRVDSSAKGITIVRTADGRVLKVKR